MNLDIDLIASRSYEASVLGPNYGQGRPVGPETYTLVIDGLIRISISKEEAETILSHMRYKIAAGNGPLMRSALNQKKQYPPEAELYKASEPDPIPDPPSDDNDEDDDDEDGDDGFAGTDDAGDGIGQY